MDGQFKTIARRIAHPFDVLLVEFLVPEAVIHKLTQDIADAIEEAWIKGRLAGVCCYLGSVKPCPHHESRNVREPR